MKDKKICFTVSSGGHYEQDDDLYDELYFDDSPY